MFFFILVFSKHSKRHMMVMMVRMLVIVTFFMLDSTAFRSPSSRLLMSFTSNVKRSTPSSLIRLRNSPIPELIQKKEAFEDLMETPPAYLLKALEKHHSKRLTISDVSALTGTDLSKAKQDVMILAYLSQAVIQVNPDGDLYFKFPQNLKERIYQRSLKYRVQKNFNKYVFPVLDQSVRIGVGSFLVLSLGLVTLTLLAAAASTTSISTSNKNGKEEKDKSKSRSSHSSPSSSYRYRSSPINFHFLFDVHDLFYLFSRSRSASRYAHLQPYSPVAQPTTFPQMTFLESCFSFLFGDGDPNIGYEENLFTEAAQFIREKDGIVIAEQLVKYLPDPPKLKETTTVSVEEGGYKTIDESYVLPLLIKFNGNQVVTKEGVILYQFEVRIQKKFFFLSNLFFLFAFSFLGINEIW
jgi:hypothetical protein